MSGVPRPHRPGPAAGAPAERPARDPDLDHVRWHDLECGGYREDLPLWREMAAERPAAHTPSRVLDLGAGTGRVALDLAGAGHAVLGIDVDPVFCAELRRRAALASVPAAAAVSDARELRLGERFGLILAPMQTVQLLDGPAGRAGLLGGIRTHLTADGVAAVAIVDEVEAFGPEDAETLAPDMRDYDGVVYASRPVGVTIADGRIALDRVREIVEPTGERHVSTDRTVLDVLDAGQLEEEGRQAGLRVLPRRVIAATEEHVGSKVVIFGV